MRGANLIQPEAKKDWARGGSAGDEYPGPSMLLTSPTQKELRRALRSR
jgi:hypothetical protein